MFTLIRNIGSSIGISVLQAMTIRNAATVHSRLVETVRPDNPNVAKAMPGLDFSSLESLLKVNGEITRQASMVSYIDAFYALFVVIILISPLILLMRPPRKQAGEQPVRSEEHSSELQSLMRISYAVFCLTKNPHALSLHLIH